jgi:hypothetical protein
MRYVKGHFVLTGPDLPSMRFKSRPEARDLVQAAYPRLADQGALQLKMTHIPYRGTGQSVPRC